MNKTLFLNGDKVRIVNCGPEIDGITGTIRGLAVDHIVQIWIIQFDTRVVGYPWDCGSFPGGCLERVA